MFITLHDTYIIIYFFNVKINLKSTKQKMGPNIKKKTLYTVFFHCGCNSYAFPALN